MTTQHLNVPPANHVKVLDGQGWVGLIDHLGSEATIVNAARVSFGKLKTEMSDKDVKLLHYLIENKHTSPLEHLVFTFSIHCPLFIRGQWHRHRTWSYNEISRRYTEIDLEFYTPNGLRRQAETNRQASVDSPDFDSSAMTEEIRQHNLKSLELYNSLLERGVCREQARGVLPQNMMVTFWGTVDLNNLLHFLELRDSEHAQWEIRQYASAIKQLIKPVIPNVVSYFEAKGQVW
ncbi:MAG: FAD-dependent thymidylate synthase [Lentisphaeria bacterium]|nr:FAD-dependent thymidylate synthase [Lentisphaeria bacterium]